MERLPSVSIGFEAAGHGGVEEPHDASHLFVLSPKGMAQVQPEQGLSPGRRPALRRPLILDHDRVPRGRTGGLA